MKPNIYQQKQMKLQFSLVFKLQFKNRTLPTNDNIYVIKVTYDEK
jgi:hypothetical protein